MKNFLEKVKAVINRLPFNNLLAKVPVLSKVSKYANYIFCALVLVFVISLFSGGEDKYVSTVKNGSFDNYPGVTVSEMIDTVLDDVKWKSLTADDGKIYVNASGTGENSEDVVFQFRVNDNGTFRFTAMEVDGDATDQYDRTLMLEAMYVLAKQE